MPNKISVFPKYTLHSASGQARVRIAGKDHYLGEYGSPASKAQYDELKEQWHLNRGDISAWSCTIDDLAIRFMEHAKIHYRKHGEPTSEVYNLRLALRPLVRLFGTMKVANFLTKHIKQYRADLVSAGIARTSINRQISRIKHVFRWGKEEGIVTAAALGEVLAIKGLQAGRSLAVESEPVKSVSIDAVEAVKPFVTRPVWGMIELQLATGMRPGEVIQLRGCDLNMAGKIWEYSPVRHKLEHRGISRVIFIGPKGQDVLREFLKVDLSAPLFSPADARAEFDEARRANRKSPMTPSQASRTAKRNRIKAPGDRYTVCSYGQAVRKACERALGMPDDLRKIPDNLPEDEKGDRRNRASEWRRVYAWHPHQLRHTAATLLRREFGIEAARTVLGHKSPKVTEIYAERDENKAREVMGKIG